MLGYATYSATGADLVNGVSNPITWTLTSSIGYSYAYIDITGQIFNAVPTGSISMMRVSLNMPGEVTGLTTEMGDSGWEPITSVISMTVNDGAGENEGSPEVGSYVLLWQGYYPTGFSVNSSALYLIDSTAFPSPPNVSFGLSSSILPDFDGSMVAALTFMSWTTP